MNKKIFTFRFLAISALVIILGMVGITAAFAEGGIFGSQGSTAKTATLSTSETNDSGQDSPSDLTETPQPGDDKNSLTASPEATASTPNSDSVCVVPGMDDSNNGSEAEFYGAIEAVDNGVYTISGLQVKTNNLTELKGAFVVGDFVKVHASLQADGTYLAREIEFSVQCLTVTPEVSGTPGAVVSSEWEFYGKVSAINGDLWTIGGNVVRVDGQTEFRGSPVVGSQVEVKAYQQGDGSWLAVRIKIED